MADLRDKLKKKSAAERLGSFEIGASPLSNQPASTYSNPATPTPLKPEWMKQQEMKSEEQMTPPAKEASSEVPTSQPQVRFEKPEDIDKFTKRLEEMTADLPEKSQAFYREQVDKLAADNKELEGAYSKERERIQWWQLAEQLGNALVQLGTGIYGARHGVDIGGVKYSQSDWESKYNRALKEHELKKNDLLAQRRDLVSSQRQEMGQVKDRINFTKQLLNEDRKNRRELYEKQLLDAQKEAKDKDGLTKSMQAKSVIMNANFKQALTAITNLKAGIDEKENEAILRDALAKTGSKQTEVDGHITAAYDLLNNFTPLENYVKGQQADWNSLVNKQGGTSVGGPRAPEEMSDAEIDAEINKLKSK